MRDERETGSESGRRRRATGGTPDDPTRDPAMVVVQQNVPRTALSHAGIDDTRRYTMRRRPEWCVSRPA